ncbi:MAG TPA: hypothetical protein PLN13_00860 [Bacteroidia bacterium]|nr:hypothetical protein [Bacteroidia bacterium]HRH07103.1 hypothetical protein [Bacteroidia bacterium]
MKFERSKKHYHIFSIIILLASAGASFWIYINQDLISDNNITAFILALCSIVAITVLSGSWNYLTNGDQISFFPKFIRPNYQLVYFGLSLLFASIVFENYSPYMFDDSAFTLRYLDNFWEGFFYHYNKSDPPVFGISSFTFGIFTGLWCWLHVLTPEQSIHFTSFLGVVAVSFLLLKILRELVKENALVLVLWFAIIFSSKMFLNVAKSGMESPFHVSIVLLAILLFLQNKSRWMWLLLAISVISKLDAVPVVFVIGLTFIITNRSNFSPINFRNNSIREFCYFAVLPILIWVLFATVVFGSPLPQSAYSKIFLHFHPSDYWFPFLKYYLQAGRVQLVFRIFGALFLAHLTFALLKHKKVSFKPLVFGMSFIAVMVLFYFYNPGEQMTWYYVLPDLLLLTQLVVSANFFIQFIRYSPVRISTALISLCFFLSWTGVDLLGGKYWMETYLERVERERLEIGKYVGTMVGKNDSIMSNHGLPVRHVKGYVIDMSGLNSKFAASFQIDPEQLFKSHHPQWAISHNSVPYAALMSQNGYAPVRLFYDVTEYAFPQWCLYRKLKPMEAKGVFKPIDSLSIVNCRPSYNGGILLYTKDTLTVKIDSSNFVNQINFGIKRGSLPFVLEIQKLKNNQVLSMDSIAISEFAEYPMDSKFTKSITLLNDTNAGINQLKLYAKKPGLPITIIEPYIYKTISN